MIALRKSKKIKVKKGNVAYTVVPCVPDTVSSMSPEEFINYLKDTGFVLNSLKEGYWIEFDTINGGKMNLRLGNSSREFDVVNTCLNEGFYLRNNKLGLWRKYIRFDKYWILWQEFLYRNDSTFSKYNVPNFENIFSNQMIDYPSCFPLFFSMRSDLFKEQYNQKYIDTSFFANKQLVTTEKTKPYSNWQRTKQ